jgi:hypothetical protein
MGPDAHRCYYLIHLVYHKKHIYRSLFYTGGFCKNEGRLVAVRDGDWPVVFRFDAVNTPPTLLSMSLSSAKRDSTNTIHLFIVHLFEVYLKVTERE